MSGTVYLRRVQIPDLRYLLDWENNPENWEVSATDNPYSEEEMLQFIFDQLEGDIEQVRYMICHEETHLPLGTIDLFEINETEARAEVGILIAEEKHRRKGYALMALLHLIALCREEYKINHLFCFIEEENYSSIGLFEKAGFKWQKRVKKEQKKLHLYRVDIKR